MSSPRCTLVILFNHPFPRNIAKLRAIYGDRFDDILFIMPMLRVDDPAVFTVYRGSFSFHGFVVDALDVLKARNSDLYLFCQDDLLLHPALTPEGFWRTAGMDEHDGFLPTPESFAQPGRESWPWYERVVTRATAPMANLFGSGVEDLVGFLPPLAEAQERFARYGVSASTTVAPPLQAPQRRDWLGRRPPAPGPVTLPYPLALAFSDFFAVRRDALDRVGHYLGLFAAADIFVEVSVATAMILGCENMATLEDTPWDVTIDWTPRATLASRGSISLASIYEGFSDTLLYTHPAKLSAVTMPGEVAGA